MYPGPKESKWPSKAKLSDGAFVIGDGQLGEITSDGLRGYICTCCGEIITEAHHIKPAKYKVIYEQQVFYMERHICDKCMGQPMKLSEEYYVMYGGTCRRVMIDKKGNMDEHPYDFKKALKCLAKGPHPHKADLVGLV